MKKLTTFVLILTLLLSFAGCDSEETDSTSNTIESKTELTGVTESYSYVQWTYQSGFIASINGIGRVFIEYDNADSEFKMFDTAIVEYDSSDLVEESGSFGDYEGYSYKIKSPKSVRKADPSKGEPVFG